MMNKEEEESTCCCSSSSSSSTNTPINSSNIGFKLLKKQGWKEGTGLGLSQQGRLHPLRAHLKTNRKGLGAEKLDKKKPQLATKSDDEGKKKAKAVSKRMKKMQEIEKRVQEKEFEQAFFREFWPENV